MRITVKQFLGVTLFILACAALVTTPSAAQKSTTLKLGYVSSDVILQQYPEAVEAQKKLDSLVRGWQGQIEKMGKELQDKYDAYGKKQGTMTDAAKAAEEQKLVQEQQKVQEFRDQKLGQGGELQKEQERTMRPVRDKIFRTIASIAKEEGVSFVFDKTEQALVLLYADEKSDLTFKVLDRLKRGQ